MTNQTVRPLFDSPDLTYIDRKVPTQRSIPPQISEIPRLVTSFSDAPHHSFLDELLGVAPGGTHDIHFEPPPGFHRKANGCFLLSVIPNLNVPLDLCSQEPIAHLQEELDILEKNFRDIKIFMLRFCKG